MHLVDVVLRISWGSLWWVGVSRSRRSWAGPHHAVGWAWRGAWARAHHTSWRWPWAWGGSGPRCPSHRGVRSGHLSGETGNVWQQQVPLWGEMTTGIKALIRIHLRPDEHAYLYNSFHTAVVVQVQIIQQLRYIITFNYFRSEPTLWTQ